MQRLMNAMMLYALEKPKRFEWISISAIIVLMFVACWDMGFFHVIGWYAATILCMFIAATTVFQATMTQLVSVLSDEFPDEVDAHPDILRMDFIETLRNRHGEKR